MAKVPAKIPPEPNESRCGDSYKDRIAVNGLIPGTDFGTQFSRFIEPVEFEGSGPYGIDSSEVPLFESEAAKNRGIAAVQDRLQDVLDKVDLETNILNASDSDTLINIAHRGMAELDRARAKKISPPALPGGNVTGDRDGIRQDVIAALKHLRCATYWVWRLVFYNQALSVYQPPFEPGTVMAPTPEDGLGLPPLPPPPEPEPQGDTDLLKPKKKAAEKKTSPWLIAGGVAVAGGIAYMLFFRKKK